MRGIQRICEHCGHLGEMPGHYRVCAACGRFVVKRRPQGENLGDCCREHLLTAVTFGLADGDLNVWLWLVKHELRLISRAKPAAQSGLKVAPSKQPPVFGTGGIVPRGRRSRARAKKGS